MFVLTTRVHPTVTAARRLTRWQRRLNVVIAFLVALLLALPLFIVT